MSSSLLSVLLAMATLGALTLVLAWILVWASRKFFVYEDPRIDEVEDLLPHANCGACGFPGCRPFAEALVSGEVLPAKCTVSSEEGRLSIANYLGVDAGSEEKRVARLACAGGINVSRQRAIYKGLQTCQAASLVSGGGKGCFWACLGMADCERVCDFDAIHMNAFGLPVVDSEKCTACGDCVDICPKDLFSLQSTQRKLWVACKNLEHGEGVLEECEVGCTACGKCVADAPAGVIKMVDNLPNIDYTLNYNERKPIERCPTGAIVWYDESGSQVKGRESAKIVRKGKRKSGTS